MQNKPNFRKAKMNVSNIITMNYQNFIPLAGQKNKPNSNPIKPNLKRAKMDINIYYTEVYENILCIRQSMKTNPNKPNSLKAQINANSLVIKDYENRWQRRVRKNKANQSQFVFFTAENAEFAEFLLIKDLCQCNWIKHNYLAMALFPLTSSTARDYNEIFSTTISNSKGKNL